jgi:hypothetical protein
MQLKLVSARHSKPATALFLNWTQSADVAFAAAKQNKSSQQQHSQNWNTSTLIYGSNSVNIKEFEINFKSNLTNISTIN